MLARTHTMRYVDRGKLTKLCLQLVTVAVLPFPNVL